VSKPRNHPENRYSNMILYDVVLQNECHSHGTGKDQEIEAADSTDPPNVVLGYVGMSVGMSVGIPVRMHLPWEVDSENLLVIAEVRSTYELRSVLDRLTLDEARLVEVSMPSKGSKGGPKEPKESEQKPLMGESCFEATTAVYRMIALNYSQLFIHFCCVMLCYKLERHVR
jgi:hypothetical protein